MNLREELYSRYKKTGKLGFKRPKDEEEALLIIEAIVNAHDDAPVDTEVEKTTLTLKQLTNELESLLSTDFMSKTIFY